MSSSVTCHLARDDGSRWIVTSYRRERDCVTICAVREFDGTRSGDARAREGEPTGNALWRTRLKEEDRLEWRDVDGRIVASSSCPPEGKSGS